MSVVVAVAILVATVLSYCFYSFHKKLQFFKELGIPGPEPRYFYGNAHELTLGTMQPFHSLIKWRKKYGSVFGIYIGTSPQLIVCDAEMVRQILVTDFAHFCNRQSHSSLGTGLKGTLIDLESQRWQEVRKICTPAFSFSKLKQLYPMICKHTQGFHKILDQAMTESNEIDIYDRFQRIVVDIVGEMILAMQTNSQHDKRSPFLETLVSMLKVSTPTALIVLYFSSTTIGKFLTYLSSFNPPEGYIRKMLKDLHQIMQTRKRLQSKTKAMDLLQIMLEVSTETEVSADKQMTNKKLLTDDEIATNLIIFVMAGFETTVSTLTNVLYMLVTHPEIQEKLYKEIITSVKDPSNMSFDDTRDIPYMEQIIDETMRIRAPAWTVNRYAVTDYQFKNFKVPKGTGILVPINIVHFDPELWPEPKQFDPDRFSPENKSKIPPGAFIPFGLGPRMCLGSTLSLLEMKTILASLVAKYKIERPTSHNFDPETQVTLIGVVPNESMYVKLVPRTVPDLKNQ